MSPTPAPLDPPIPRRPYRAWALALWLVSLAAVCVLVSLDPVKRSVTPVFHLAAQRWWARQGLYADVRGFHYLPQFALLFVPFHALPVPIGDVLWRAVSVWLVLSGIGTFLRRTDLDGHGRLFFFSCLLALTPCLGAVRNGQTNLAFAGLCMLLATFLASERWSLAALCLVALVAVKPLGLVFVLLAPWVYPGVRKPAAIGLALFAALPFLFASPRYAIEQYRSAAAHLVEWSGTTERRFADAAALLRAMGVPLSGAAALGARVFAAVATLWLWLRAASRVREPWRALTLVLLGSIYLMLFNPMTEKNSYAIVAPTFAVAAVACLSPGGSRRFGWLLVFAVVSIGVFPEIFGHLDGGFGLWWDPLVTVAVGGALAYAVVRGTEATLFPPGPSG